MIATRRRSRAAARCAADDGFTLIEALASVAVMAAILWCLGAITGQWIPNWSRGLAAAQRDDLLGLGLERIAADVAGAQYVSSQGASRTPFFEGEPSQVTFVRAAYGPGARDALEIVRIGERRDGAGLSTVREQAPFTPPPADAAVARIALKDPVVLAREPFRLAFAYAGPDRNWVSAWRDATALPSAVRVSVRDATTNRTLAASTAFRLHVTAPPPQVKPEDEASAQPGARTADR
jgi:general secretion pathway protein J